MLCHLTRLLVLPTVMLSVCFAYAQSSREIHDKEIERLRKTADSLHREARKLESRANRYAGKVADSIFGLGKKYSDSIQSWTKKFSDSLMQQFRLEDVPFFTVPRMPKYDLPQYPYPRYFNDPKLPGIPYPDPRNQWDERNIEPLPRVIPRRRDSKEVPGFPGWRIEKLKNLT